MHWVAAVFDRWQMRAHEFACSVEGVVVAARGDFALHRGSLCGHCGFSLSTARTRAARKPLQQRIEISTRARHDETGAWKRSNMVIPTFDDETHAEGCSFHLLAPSAFELDGERVEAERAEEVAAHAALYGVHGSHGLFDPVEGEGVGEALEVGALVDIA